MMTAFISRWASGRARLMICQKRGASYGRCATVSPLFHQAQVFSSNVKTNCGERKAVKVGPRQETAQLMKME